MPVGAPLASFNGDGLEVEELVDEGSVDEVLEDEGSVDEELAVGFSSDEFLSVIAIVVGSNRQ